MKTPRNVKRSYFTKLEELFEDAGTLGTAYNIYYEDDLRDEVAPERPSLYLLDAGVSFPASSLPLVAVWMEFSYRPFQMGGPALWHVRVENDVYARNRGEREDISAAIAEGIASEFDIDDYSGGSAAAWGTASIVDDPSYWHVMYESVGDQESVEGTLLNWAKASSQFWCKPTSS